MSRFAQTQDWLGIAAATLSTASEAIYKTYGSGELLNYERADMRIESLRQKAVELYEEVLNVKAALDEPVGENEPQEVVEERYQMGLMSPEEEMAYIFPKRENLNELPF